ncbi:hypothetical protein APS_0247 [Acetobacter pasteurianus subsp. pasteurianus LMG 1262 = NBRC 106471]|nr:hypothetical protein APS_0247 [Acetobacter pasteurianus subsp. pasteurianus LMG 1262 = NBRC 106471]
MLHLDTRKKAHMQAASMQGLHLPCRFRLASTCPTLYRKARSAQEDRIT